MACKIQTLLLSFLLLNIATVCLCEIQVKTPLGVLQGKQLKSRNGNEIEAFLGIPYALPPQRFEESTTWNQAWENIRPATEFGPVCIQWASKDRKIIGSENCLFLNIYRPQKTEEKTSLPVIVWMHGGLGTFYSGSGNEYAPQYFMDEPIILVTINYRLGSLGFLSTNDSTVPANLGLKDQVTSLKWLKENIKSFGGDPSKVTIAGQGSGAASVSFHLLSHKSSGLFHGAIAQSGSFLCPWALVEDPLTNTKRLAKQIGCMKDELHKMIGCIKKKDAEDIIQAERKIRSPEKFNDGLMLFNTLFGPVAEYGEENSAFLPQSAISSKTIVNKIPLILGFNEDEAALISSQIFTNETLVAEIEDQWPQLSYLLFDKSSVKRDETLEQIRNFYFGQNNDIDGNSWHTFTQMLSDWYFVKGITKWGHLHATQATAYGYVFTFPGGFSFSRSQPHLPQENNIKHDEDDSMEEEALTGFIGHADELQYLFPGIFGAPQSNSEQEVTDFSKQLVKLWVNFAATRKPGTMWPEKKGARWRALQASNPLTRWTTLDIKMETWEPSDYQKERLNFWESISFPNSKTLKDEL